MVNTPAIGPGIDGVTQVKKYFEIAVVALVAIAAVKRLNIPVLKDLIA